MYLGKKKLSDPEGYEARREKIISEKSGAVFTAFSELEGLLSKTQVARQYFGKSQGWFSQKLNGCTLHKRRQSFTEAEYHELAEAFRHIARRLEAHADEIDAAEMDAPDE